MKRVTGIGGIFFKAKDQKKMSDWYEKHLALKQDPGGEGAGLRWRELDNPDLFRQDTRYFDSSRAPFRINYRVDDPDALLETLREDFDYGRFAWIMDPEGNRIELWEHPKE